MRELLILVVSVLSAAVPASAQVSVDLHALEALPRTSAPPRPAARPPVRPNVTLAPTAPAAAPPHPAEAAPVPAPTPAPATPPAPVAAAEMPTAPPPPVPATEQPPARVTSAEPAPEAPKPVTTNLRIPFGADQTDLGKEGTAALEGLLHAAYVGGPPTFTIIAYAAGTRDDPSSARRLSLARALSARNTLIADGVPSRRITVRALGSQAGDGPPDRVDISATPSTAP